MDFKNFLEFVNEAESTAKKDHKAEKAGKKVAKDIEYDEGHKGKDDKKAEKAGKKVTKDIEYDDKKDKKKSLKDWFEIVDKNLLAEAEQITMEPAKQNTQVIKQGTKTLGTVSNPQLAAQIKQSIGKGEMSLAGHEIKEEEVDESALQAYLGKMKYGPKGMKALQKAGRAGASKEKMAQIRAKHDKLDEVQVDEKAKNPYAIGMAQAMKSAGDKPPLKKSTITKAHDIAKSIKKKTDEAEIPSSGPDYGAGLGAGRKDNVLEAKPDFLDLDKDGNKKESMKKAAADKKKKKVDESMDKCKSAYHEGKAHGLSKHGYACRYDHGSPEHEHYHKGFKEGLDECYGLMPVQGLVVSETEPAATVPGMASQAMPAMEDLTKVGISDELAAKKIAQKIMGTPNLNINNIKKYVTRYLDMVGKASTDVDHIAALVHSELDSKGLIEADMEEGNAFTAALAKTPKGDKFSVGGKTFTDRSDYNAKIDEFAFESLDKQLNDLLNEGLSVNMSQGLGNGLGGQVDDTVSVTATDDDAAKLLDFIKQVGLGGLGADKAEVSSVEPIAAVSDYGAPKFSGNDVGMADLLSKVSDGEGHEHGDAPKMKMCGVHKLPEGECGCGEGKEVVDEVETEDQMMYQVAEDDGEGYEQSQADAGKIDSALALSGASKGGATNEGGDGGESSPKAADAVDAADAAEEEDEAMSEGKKLDEWANDAGKDGTDATFERDIEFMTKVISGGLNKPKSTGQTTIPVIAGQTDRMGVSEDVIAEWKKLSGIR